jgi:hypothetical protein
MYSEIVRSQWTFNPNLAPSLLYPVVNNPCPNGNCGERKTFKAVRSNKQNPINDTRLTYRTSASTRRNNLANFIEKIRTNDPVSASQIEQLFSSTATFDRIDKAMAAMNLKSNNVADAYAVYLINAWLGARGRNDDLPKAQIVAIRNQSAQTLLAIPQFTGATNTDKQQMAEEMLIRAALISAAIDGAKSDPAILNQVKISISQGAKQMGMDLDRLTITSQGFQPVN